MGSCSGTDGRLQRGGPSGQRDGSPGVKQADIVQAGESRRWGSEPASQEVVAGWERGWAALVLWSVKVLVVLEGSEAERWDGLLNDRAAGPDQRGGETSDWEHWLVRAAARGEQPPGGWKDPSQSGDLLVQQTS